MKPATPTNGVMMTGRDGAFDYVAKSEVAAGGADSFPLDQGSDFTIEQGGRIVITQEGLYQITAAHGTGLDAIVIVDNAERVRFKAS